MLPRLALIVCALLIAGCGGGAVVSPPATPVEGFVAPIEEAKIVIDPSTGERYASDRIAVVFREGVSQRDAEQIIRTTGGEKIGHIPEVNAYEIGVPASTTPDELAGRYNAIASVEVAGRHYLAQFLSSGPPEYNPTNFWALDRIDAERVWPTTLGSGVTVAIVDTGVRASHSDLKEAYAGGKDYWSGRDPTRDTVGHGTAVASVVAGAAGAGDSLGVAPRARIFAYRIGSKVGPVDILNPLAGALAIVHAANSGIKVINVSWGFSSPWLVADRFLSMISTVNRAIKYARGKGALVLVAAGNENRSNCAPPAHLSEAICVVATNRADGRASFSNYGPEADIAAPGVDIRAASSSSDTASWSVDGTSFAAPMVAGSIALMLSINASLSSDQVIDILKRTANPSVAGVGLLNVEKAIIEARIPVNVYDNTHNGWNVLTPDPITRGPDPSLGTVSFRPTTSSDPNSIRISVSISNAAQNCTLTIELVTVGNNPGAGLPPDGGHTGIINRIGTLTTNAAGSGSSSAITVDARSLASVASAGDLTFAHVDLEDGTGRCREADGTAVVANEYGASGKPPGSTLSLPLNIHWIQPSGTIPSTQFPGGEKD